MFSQKFEFLLIYAIFFGLNFRVLDIHKNRQFWFKYDLGQKYEAPKVRPDRDLNS